jgi:HEAT repeat protein
MSTHLAAALCLLVIDIGAPSVSPGGAPVQADDIRDAVDAVARGWRSEELSSEELTLRLVALGAKAEPHVVELLVAARRATPGELPPPLPVAALAEALRSIGGEASLGALVEVLGAEAEEERLAAADALGGLGLAGGLVPLLDTLDDESDLVRAAAGAATLALAAEHPDFALVRALEVRWREYVRRDQLGLVLGRLGTDDARAVLCAKLVSAHEESAALAALGGLWLCAGPSDCEAVLDVLVSTSSLAVRRKTCLLLGKLGHGPAVRTLIDLLHEDDRGLVHDAHWALQRITGQLLRAEAALWESWWERSGESR